MYGRERTSCLNSKASFTLPSVAASRLLTSSSLDNGTSDTDFNSRCRTAVTLEVALEVAVEVVFGVGDRVKIEY